MILKTNEIRSICSKILPAVDVSNYSLITETLQLQVKDGSLHLSVTNKEYFVETILPLPDVEDCIATVNANLFLKLMNNMTTETVEFIIDETNLSIRGNGEYKLPLVFDGDKMLIQPRINIDNVTTEMNIESDKLRSIYTYNTKELTKCGGATQPMQNIFYMDEQGCLTFTRGACVNKFALEKPVVVELTAKLVKLFNLFDKDTVVHFTMGYDQLTKQVAQTKVKFVTPTVEITSLLPIKEPDRKSFPAEAIRSRAFNSYPYMAVFNKEYMIQAINRLMVFVSDAKIAQYVYMGFTNDAVEISGYDRQNKEKVYFENALNITAPNGVYEMQMDMNDLKATLMSCNDQYVNFAFGDHQATVISRGNIYNVLPENIG